MNTITRFLLIVPLAFLSARPESAAGLPAFPAAFCGTYPQSGLCTNGSTSCKTCHQSDSGGPRNPYGTDLESHGIRTDVEDALKAIEDLDSDQDGAANFEEIKAGTNPGVAQPLTPGDGDSCEARDAQTSYQVCGVDLNFTFRRLMRDFCGRSPTFAEDQEFRKLATDPEKQAKVARQLDSCLASEYWRGKDGFVWQLAYPKILPVRGIKAGPEGGPTPLGDYLPDFALYSYYSLDYQDVRGILLAQHYALQATENGSTVYRQVENVPLPAENPGPLLTLTAAFNAGEDQILNQQNVAKTRRAGMITTNYRFAVNWMFTSVPRGAASFILDNYLGWDIAQAIMPPVLDPALHETFLKDDPGFRDYDNKGVTKNTAQANCAGCHEVLDPIAYVFAKYNGFLPQIDAKAYDQWLKEEFPTKAFSRDKVLLQLFGKLLGGIGGGGGGGGGDSGGTGNIQQLVDLITSISPEHRASLLASGAFMLPYSFNERRVELIAPSVQQLEPDLEMLPKRSFILDTEYRDLQEFARRVVNTDEYYKKLVLDYWQRLFRRPPAESEKADFDALWKDLKRRNDAAPYPAAADKAPSVFSMLHMMIQTKSYGSP